MLPTTLHDVTAIITFHREALLAHKSLLSLQRCRMAASSAGISLEVVATLDRADEETTRIVHSHLANGCVDRVLHLDCGDLGLSRNQAVLASSGARILICDGDDYLSADFLIRCHQRAEALPGSAILHPELIVTFEAETGLWWQRAARSTSSCPMRKRVQASRVSGSKTGTGTARPMPGGMLTSLPSGQSTTSGKSALAR